MTPFKLWAVLICLVTIPSGIYTIATGDTLFTNVTYNVPGRILVALSLIAVGVFAIYAIRADRRLSASIPHRCGEYDGEARCIEVEGHDGPHDFRFDYPDGDG